MQWPRQTQSDRRYGGALSLSCAQCDSNALALLLCFDCSLTSLQLSGFLALPLLVQQACTLPGVTALKLR